MANDTTETTDTLSIEYPVDGYDSGSPTWGELYAQAFEDIDSAIGGFINEEEAQDAVDALLSGGDKVQLTYDDANDELTIDTSALDAEEVRGEVASLLTEGNALDVTIDDAGDSVTLTVDEGAISHDNIADVSAADHHTRYSDSEAVSAVNSDADHGSTASHNYRTDEEVQDVADALLSAGDKVTTTYDDANDTLTIDTSALDAEEVRDEVGTLLSAGNGIAITVNDAGDTVTLSIPTDAVGTDELDEAITPTWTGEHEFSGGVTGLPEPTDASDAARKSYVDAIKQGLDAKDPVVATTTGNIDLTSSADPNPVDGVTLSDGDRVLLKDQTDASENGIYVASTATDPTTWTRAPDADADDEVTPGLFTFVKEGDTTADSAFILATDGDITLGTTGLSFVQFSGGGDLFPGDGLTKTGSTLDVSVADFAGLGLVDSGSNDLDVDESAISHDNISDVSEGDHRTTEQVQDIVGALVSGTGNISVTYDDGNDTLQIDTSALNTEEVEDAVSQLVSAGSNLSWTYDDANDSLTISLDAHGSTHEKGGSDELTTFGDTTHDSVSVSASIENATYPTLSDVPSSLPEGTQVYVADENAIYVEDGT